MKTVDVRFSKIRDVATPAYGTDGSAGLDMFVPNDMEWETITVVPGDSINIPSGIKLEVPFGHAFVTHNKSGVALKKSLIVGATVIDSDYQGEVHIHVINVGTHSQVIKRGEKLIQLLLVPLVQAFLWQVEESMLYPVKTKRSDGGFGSTGTGVNQQDQGTKA